MAGLGDLLGGLLGGLSKSSGSSSSSSAGGGLGDILGGLLGDSGRNAALMTALLPILIGLLSRGGLSKILSGMQAQGLSSQADSWVGKGGNATISGDQAVGVIGKSKVAKIAKKLGVSQGKAADAIAELLPKVINQVTPNGQVTARRELKGTLKQLKRAAAK